MGYEERFIYYFRVLFYERTLGNIKICLGDGATKAEIKSTAKAFYENLGMNLMEVFYFRPLTSEYIESSIEFEGFEFIDKALKKNKGVLIMGAHYGNWEMFGYLMGYKGYPMDSVYKAFDNKYLDKLMRDRRAFYGGAPIEMKNAVVKILKSLKNNHLVCMLFDQRAEPKESLYMDFMGREARTNKGLAMIAMRTGAPVVPVFITRTAKGHKLVVQDEVPISITGDKDKDIITNTSMFNKVLEEKVKERPDQWLCCLPRWKSSAPTIVEED